MLKKFAVVVLAFGIVLTLLFPKITLAQELVDDSPWWKPGYRKFVDKVENAPEDEIFGERYTHAQVSWIINSLVNLIGGDIAKCANEGGNPIDCLNRELTGYNSFYPGPIFTVANFAEQIASTKPASGVEYVAQKLDKFNLIQPVYAQVEGFGFANSLAPVQKLWVASRDAAYGLSTIVIITLALMVMIRVKLSPQTVITVQTAIPRIALSLILITFSYAIAGFLVDLAFVSQGLIAALVSTITDISDATALDIFNHLNYAVRGIFAYGIAVTLQAISGTGLLSRTTSVPIADQLYSGLDVIIALIIILLLLIAFIRVVWLMLITYVKLILIVVASPFFIIVGTLMPSGKMFGWIKSIIAQLSVFVVIGGMILLAHILYYSTGNDYGGASIADMLAGVLRLNPFSIVPITYPEGAGIFPSGFNFSDVSTLGFFVSLVMILSIPKTANSLRDQIEYGSAQWGLDTVGAIVGGRAAGLGIGLAGERIGVGISRLESGIKSTGGTAGQFAALQRLKYLSQFTDFLGRFFKR